MYESIKGVCHINRVNETANIICSLQSIKAANFIGFIMIQFNVQFFCRFKKNYEILVVTGNQIQYHMLNTQANL